MSVDRDSRTVVGIVSTDALDRDFEVILPDALNWDLFHRNPVVLWMHDLSRPIGRSLWVKRDSGRTVAKTQFSGSPQASELFELYAEGYLKGWSVGMDPMTIRRRTPTESEIVQNPGYADARYVIHSAHVAEYSAVTIPSNPEALTKAWRKGMIRETEAFFDDALTRGVTPVKTVIPVSRVETVCPVSRVHQI